MWDAAESNLGLPVSLLVNNAGVNPVVGWELCLDIMLKGVVTGTMLAVERMDHTKEVREAVRRSLKWTLGNRT